MTNKMSVQVVQRNLEFLNGQNLSHSIPWVFHDAAVSVIPIFFCKARLIVQISVLCEKKHSKAQDVASKC
jgi:hypothetical protein